MVSRICIPLICFIQSPGFCSPSFSLPPSHAAHDSVLWKGKREMGLFGNSPHSWSSQVLIPMLLLTPVGEITSQEGLSFSELCHFGEEVMQVKSKYSFYPLQCVKVSNLGFFFYSCGVLELLHWTLRFSQRLCHLWVIV